MKLRSVELREESRQENVRTQEGGPQEMEAMWMPLGLGGGSLEASPAGPREQSGRGKLRFCTGAPKEGKAGQRSSSGSWG